MDNEFRWLKVAPEGQPDLEIVLMPPTNPKGGLHALANDTEWSKKGSRDEKRALIEQTL